MTQAAQSELGIGENFGVGGAFSKWGAALASARVRAKSHPEQRLCRAHR